jgi:sulfate transport system substrate-binding protein
LPNNASPYTSTIVFVVRKGNPKKIKDWPDLVRGDVKIVTPNPKTSGGARWTFLAGYGWAAGATKDGGQLDDVKGAEYIRKFYKNVPVLDTGARGSTVTFTTKNVGDVLPTWENEAFLTIEEFGKDKYEIVYPSASILAEPPVAVVDKVVDARGTRKAAEAYLKYLYTDEAQELIAQLHYRPRSEAVLKKHAAELPPLPLFTIDQTFGGWEAAQAKFFADGGVFDQIYAPVK